MAELGQGPCTVGQVGVAADGTETPPPAYTYNSPTLKIGGRAPCGSLRQILQRERCWQLRLWRVASTDP